MLKNGHKYASALVTLGLASAIAGLGCGGGGMTTAPPPVPTTATLIVVQGIEDQPVSVSLDGQIIAENLVYLNSTSPLIVASGQHELLLQNASGPLTGGPNSLDLSPNTRNTFTYYGYGLGTQGPSLLVDDTTPAAGSNAKLRIAEYASLFPGVDVYLVPFGSGPTGTPLLSELGLSNFPTTYQVVPPGNYDIYFTASGTMGTQVFYHTGSFPLAANQNRTVLFMNGCPTAGIDGCNVAGGYTAVTVADLN
jgi:hypothetical protein